MPIKEIICLAYSRKMGGSCFAGIDTDSRQWIRAIGTHQNGALADNDCFMQDGTGKFVLPTVLDVIEIGFSAPAPTLAQPENWKISGSEWKKLRRAGILDADLLNRSLADDPELFRGYERYITKEDIDLRPPKSSLALVRPENLRWNPKRDVYRRNVYRGTFTVSGATYDLPLTDDRYAATLVAKSLTGGPIDASAVTLLTISLGDLYEKTGRYYKLIAGVVESGVISI